AIINSLIDEDWPEATLAEEAESIRNGWSAQQDLKGLATGSLKLSCVHSRTIDDSDTKSVKVTARVREEFAIKEDDVFLVRGNGSAHLVGRTAIAARSNPNVIFNDLLIRIRPGQNILPTYLNLIFHSRGVRQQILEHAKTAAGIWKINQTGLGKIRIPLPSTVSQKQFVDRATAALSGSGELTKLSDLADFSALRNAILRQAFAGEL
ncbi:MAG: restriction endonuclease subunit S, partial [Verrucomicrobiae bacterium]|nr:restriction endonuclease subunit S [Verrucomicrobiae bacterium]